MELALLCAAAWGTLPAAGRECRARCARRGRPGASQGRATPLRSPSPPRRGSARARAHLALTLTLTLTLTDAFPVITYPYP